MHDGKLEGCVCVCWGGRVIERQIQTNNKCDMNHAKINEPSTNMLKSMWTPVPIMTSASA